MKKLYIFSFLLILSTSNVFSQSGWFWQNPKPQGNDLNCIKFINDNTGWAVGKKGTIIKTSDAGNNWQIQNSKTTEILYNLLFVNENIGIVVGEKGTILRTSNGGLNWVSVFILDNTKFNGIYFQDQQTGWVCGYDNNNDGHGMIYKTTNSGITWTLNFSTQYSEQFYKIHFINLNTGFVDSGTYYYKTTNGGNNWSWVGILSSSLDFEMIDSLNIFFAGGYTLGSTPHGTIKKSTNGGANMITMVNIVDTILRSVDFINLNTGFVVGQKGKILKTTNFGVNWSRVISPAYANLNSVYFRDSINGIVAGDFGTLYGTSNSGDSWVMKTGGFINSNLSSAVFVNYNTGIAVGQNYILKTTNSGNEWLLKYNDPSLFWNKIQMLDENLGYSSCNLRKLYKTTDGGENWNFFSTFGEDFVSTNMGYSFQIFNSGIGYACGFKSEINPAFNTKRIFKTSNGGLNWISVYSGGSGMLSDVHFINESTGIVIGSSFVRKTTNGGVDWILYNGTSSTDTRVLYFDTSNVWVIGNESVFKSENGGINWLTKFTQVGELFTSIKFINENYGWITSRKGNLYATSNGGNNWFYQNTPNQYGLNDAYFISPGTGWVFGDKGAIMKTISGVIPNSLVPVSLEMPAKFSLSQNYPNPFNPVTKIQFQIPSVGQRHAFDTKLIVYDISGRLVTTLVNEQLQPGSYSVDWDGTGYASGVYFYSLITNEFTETKRMVLVK